MFGWLQNILGSGRANDDPFSGVPKTYVLFDFLGLQQTNAPAIQKIVAAGHLGDGQVTSLQKYLREITRIGSTKLIVSQHRQSMRRNLSHRFTLDLRPAFAAVIEPFEQRNLAVVTELEPPEESAALLEADQKSVLVAEIGDLISFQVSDSKWPLAIYCHICNGSGKVPCKRCNGQGWYRNKAGQKKACGSEECQNGKRPCFYCHGEKFRGCGLLHQKESFSLKLPEEVRGIKDIPIFVNGQQLSIDDNSLFKKSLALEQNVAPTAKQSITSSPEAVFHQECNEMHRFLLMEVEAETEEFSALRVSGGKFLEAGGQGSRPSLSFESSRSVPRWSVDERMLLVAPLESLVYRVDFLSANEGTITVRMRDKLESGDRVPAEGFLIAGEGLRIFEAQNRALQYWTEARSLAHPVKRALAEPEILEFPEAPKLSEFFNPGVAENAAQRQAVERALDKQRPIFCIQGPPGTGKTTVIAEIVAQHFYQGGHKVLISSQSNLAVDNVLERLAEIPELSLLRIGRSDKVQIDLHPYLLELSLERFPPNTRREKASQLIDESQIIGATCIGADNSLLRPRNFSAGDTQPFDLVIIDEAGRSTAMETYIPMSLGTRAILVGDHKQLPPVVSSALRELWLRRGEQEALEKSVGAVSLFEKLVHRLPPASLTVLTRQFRMHPQIGDFIGQVFYPNEKLENGASEESKLLALPEFPAALSYHSTKTFGEKRFDIQSGSSKENPAEADLIVGLVALLDEFLPSKETAKPSVGVLCFYSGQVQRLRKMLKSIRLENLDFLPGEDIATLDSYQGKEKDIIILSLVRCPRAAEKFNAEWYQFFLDVRRLNVALSRAKKRLLIVGDLEQLLKVEKNRDNIEGFEVIERLWDYIQEHQLTVNTLNA